MSETILFKGHHINIKTYNKAVDIVNTYIDTITDRQYKDIMGGYDGDINMYITDMIFETSRALTGTRTKFQNDPILPEVSESLRETLRKADMNYFVDDVFGDKVEMGWHHMEWGNMAKAMNNTAILASRDHGKSFWWSHLYPIWRMYQYEGTVEQEKSNKNKLFMFSHTDEKAAEFLGEIKQSIEEIPVLRNKLFPIKNKGWADTKIRTRNGCELRVKGFMTAARGYHPAYIICDDVLKENDLFSPTQREKTIHIFKSVVMQMLVPNGKLVIVGTPFHTEDLYHLFRSDEFDDWTYQEYPAIFPSGKILWENRYDFDTLMRRKRKLGVVAFSREFLCRPLSSESSLFPYKILKKSIIGMEHYTFINNIEASPMQFESVVVGCDFATSANIGADYTVFTVWGIDNQENMWLLYMYRKLGATFNEQIGKLRTINTNFRPQLFILENNNFQSLYSQNLLDSGLPIKGHTTTGQKNDLKSGLPSMAVLFERGKVRLPYGDEASKNASEVIMSEFNSVTFTDKGLRSVGGHDDTCMSCWFGRIAMQEVHTNSFSFEFI